MKQYITEIKALSPIDGEIKTFAGPEVPGISFSDAQSFCENNGLGYCKVIGELVAEIPCKHGTYAADFSKMIDFETQNNN